MSRTWARCSSPRYASGCLSPAISWRQITVCRRRPLRTLSSVGQVVRLDAVADLVAPAVELLAHDADGRRVEPRLQVVEQLLQALDAALVEHALPDQGMVGAGLAIAAAHPPVRVGEPVAELVGLPEGLVHRPQVLVDLHVARAKLRAERLALHVALGALACGGDQRGERRGLRRHARALGVPGRRAQLELELIGPREAAVGGQQRVRRAVVVVVDERVQLCDAPAERHRGGEVGVL